MLDDAAALAKPRLLGNHYVTTETQKIRLMAAFAPNPGYCLSGRDERFMSGHVGDAILFSMESRFIPLFKSWEPGLGATNALLVRARPANPPELVAQHGTTQTVAALTETRELIGS